MPPRERGWGAQAVTVSPLPGPSGNVEFFLWLRHGPQAVDDESVAADRQARDVGTG